MQIHAPCLRILGAIWLCLHLASRSGLAAADTTPTLSTTRPRVLVSTDVGGTDPDDVQSLVHLLVYADRLELEGLVSSPPGPGRLQHILEGIDAYAADLPWLRRHSPDYPSAALLRERSHQGATDPAPFAGHSVPTAGSEWIIRCARRPSDQPLHVLIWGGLEDLAQALHDAPDILPVLRVHFIGGPNKKWGPDAYQYLVERHPGLWFIESNATYRGWFLGGPRDGEWSNTGFVARSVTPCGALGRLFGRQLRGSMKMGDTPTVARLLHGDALDPGTPSWGGTFVRAWERPFQRFTRLTTAADTIELFGILELRLPVPTPGTKPVESTLHLGNQSVTGHDDGQGNLCFRVCPRDPGVLRYRIESTHPGWTVLTGEISVNLPSPDAARRPSVGHPNWWTDDPDPALAEGIHHGARTISRWREEYLADFAARMSRCPRNP